MAKTDEHRERRPTAGLTRDELLDEIERLQNDLAAARAEVEWVTKERDNTVAAWKNIVRIATDLRAERDALKVDAERTKRRYDYVRALSVPEFASLFTRCATLNLRYDDEVDRAIAARKEQQC